MVKGRSSSAARRRRRTVPTTDSKASLDAPSTAPVQSSPRTEPKPAAEAHHAPSAFVVMTTYLAYAILVVLGHIRDFLGRIAGSRYSVLRGSHVSPPARRPRPR